MKLDMQKVAPALIDWVRNWFEENGPGCNAVVGISGGKDSSVCAALCVAALGKNRVIGGYREFVNFVINNLDSYICLRGFSRVDYSHLVMIILGLEKPNVRLEKTGIKTNKTKKKVNSKFKRK